MSATQAVKDRFADYVPVSERLEQFYSDHPEGRILTTIVEHDAENGFVLIRAEVYKQLDDAVPIATGHAFENRSEGYVNKTSYIENCETSAAGRALALAGYEIKRGIASREEMEKTERMNNGTGGQSDADAMKCPGCGETKAVIKGKAEYGGGYLCFKKKGGCGAKWGTEPKTEGFGPDQVARDKFFQEAEKLLGSLTEDKRKDALGRLVLLSTDEMGKKVAELAETARKKTKVKPDAEAERQKKITAIRDNVSEEDIVDYVNEHFKGVPLGVLGLDALTQMHDDLVVPF